MMIKKREQTTFSSPQQLHYMLEHFWNTCTL